MSRALLIIGMSIIGFFSTLIMKKIAPEEKWYSSWVLLILILFALIIFTI